MHILSRCGPILKNLFLKEIKKLHMEAGRNQNYLTNIKIEAPLLVKRLSKVAQNARNRRFLVKERKNALSAEYICVVRSGFSEHFTYFIRRLLQFFECVQSIMHNAVRGPGG